MVSTQEFESVVSRFYKPLYQFAFSLTRAEADACDLTQQTFYVWATKGHQLRDNSKLKTWLFTTLHRMFLETHRRQTRFPHQELDGALMETLTSTSAELTRLDTAQAMNALSRLDAIYQAPVSLFYLQDCSYKEIAETLKLAPASIGPLLLRAEREFEKKYRALTQEERP